ncbi:MAG: YceI family protein [Rhodothermales bacterium]|nr:YceI family protein [Rhodothermales bacterium]
MFSNAFKTMTAGILLIGFTAGQQVLSVSAQAFDMARESIVWIEGTSTVNSFVCSTDDVAGSGVLSIDRNQEAGSAAAPGPTSDPGTGRQADTTSSDVSVHVPATRLDCGLPAMNRDLRESLKVDMQPTIDFRLGRTELLAAPEKNGGLYLLRAHGWLSLAGTERQIDVILEGERTDTGTLRGWGSKDLRMSDFGIKPPSALFGLVRAHDEITVRFNFIAEPHGTAAK